jgi:hypothetical protein
MKLITRTCMAFYAIASLLVWSACTKSSHTEIIAESTETANIRSLSVTTSELLVNRTEISTSSVPALCGTITTKNFLTNTTVCGSIQVGNDATDYYITISGATGWSLKDIRMYVGTEAGIPVNSGNGMPKHNEFPIQKNYNAPCPASWSLKIPIADLGGTSWISVRVSFVSASNQVQSLWSEGIGFPPSNNGSKFSFNQQICIIDEGCAFGQGYWFGNGNQSWPDVNGATDGDITIGGENYTRAEARAIWWANNGQCPGIPNAKKAFAFVAAIRLSHDNVIGTASLWSDVALADGWLQSLDRLTPANICSHPDASAEVMAAVARMGAWMDEHGCE